MQACMQVWLQVKKYTNMKVCKVASNTVIEYASKGGSF